MLQHPCEDLQFVKKKGSQLLLKPLKKQLAGFFRNRLRGNRLRWENFTWPFSGKHRQLSFRGCKIDKIFPYKALCPTERSQTTPTPGEQITNANILRKMDFNKDETDNARVCFAIISIDYVRMDLVTQTENRAALGANRLKNLKNTMQCGSSPAVSFLLFKPYTDISSGQTTRNSSWEECNQKISQHDNLVAWLPKPFNILSVKFKKNVNWTGQDWDKQSLRDQKPTFENDSTETVDTLESKAIQLYLTRRFQVG